MKKLLIRGGLAAATGLLPGQAAHATSFNIAAGATVTTGQTLLNTETGQVQATGVLSTSGTTVSVTMSNNSGANTSLTNSGTIQQTGTGRAIRNNVANTTLTITNNATGVIESHGQDTFQMNQDSTVTLNNSGRIEAVNDGTGTGQALDWAAISSKANTLNNYSGAVIKSTGEDTVRPGVNGVINNAGTIQAVPVDAGGGTASGSDGVDTGTRTGVQVTNSGLIEGRHGITGGSNGTTAYHIGVTNNAGGIIRGANGSGVNIDSEVSTTTIFNSGTIEGLWDNANFTSGDGDGIDVDGIANITNNGIIRGNGADAVNLAQGVAIGGGTIVNNAGAEISGQNTTGNGSEGEGIRVDDSDGGDAFAAVDITNSGTIRGHHGSGIDIRSAFDNTITNNAGGTIQGGNGEGAIMAIGTGNETVINRGTIIGDGGQAIDLGGGDNTLTIEGGSASIQGDMSGGVGGTNTLNFDLGAGNSFAYADDLSNFANVNVNSGTASLSGSVLGTGTLVDVKSGATLGGTGDIEGDVTVESGGTLAPGNSIGTISVGDLTLAASSILDIEIDPSQGISDQLDVTGLVSIDLSDLVLTLLSEPTPGQIFDIVINDGIDSVIGQFSQGTHITAMFGGQSYGFSIVYDANADGGSIGNDIRLQADTVPEPATGLLFGLGGLALARQRRRARA